MSDEEPTPVFGPRPELPPRPTVPDDRIHGDSLPGPVGRHGPEPQRPPAAPGLPAPGSPPKSRRGRRRWAVLAVGAAAIVGLNVSRDAGSVQTQTTLTHAVTGIRVSNDSGDVEVSAGAPAGTVDLTRRLPRDSDTSSTAGQRWEGNTLVIDSNAGCGPLVVGCSVDYTLRVPAGTKVTIDAGSGDLELGGSLGAVAVEAGSGDIDAKALQSATLAARTGSGDIKLALSQAPTQLTVNTGSGDVDIEVPSDDTYAVDAQTGSGDEKIGVKTDPNSPRTAQIKTGSGDIEFGYR